MTTLIVIAHPSPESLCRTLAARAIETLHSAGHEVIVEDLYHNNFNAALTKAERASYYEHPYDASAVQPEINRLLNAEGLILFFPTWWFGFPAILKGWFDRVWAPGAAYDHASDLGPIQPRLHNLRKVLAVTSLGASWWVDKLVMRQPVKRVIKTAILGACAPRCEFDMLSLYNAERVGEEEVGQFSAKVERALGKWG